MVKAIANECKIPFILATLSEEDKKGDNILKNAFTRAKDYNTPVIIYIDEIDKFVANTRYESDDSRLNLQYLLTQLDGIGTSSKILVIASTNEYERLPFALLRSGRMDKKISIDLPSLESRIEILKYYIKDKAYFNNLQESDIKSLAIKLKGMNCADIKTLINNTLIEYIDSKEFVTIDDFVPVLNEMNFETIGKRWISQVSVKEILAHEVGHSLVSYILNGVHGSISAVRYGDTAGFTDFLDEELNILSDDDTVDIFEEEERELFKKSSIPTLFDEMCIALGGMAAEEIYLGSTSTGVQQDLRVAISIFSTIASSGYKKFKLLTNDEVSYREDILLRRYVRTKEHALIKQYNRAKKIINQNKYLGRYLIDKALENDEVLSSNQIDIAIDFYNKHKSLIDKSYKNKPLFKEGEE